MTNIHAYAAGILDGEGTITLTPSKGKHRVPVVSIANTSLEILEFFKLNFGGTICSKRTSSDHHTPSFTWRLTYQRAIDFLELLLPYMLESKKRYRAELLISTYSSVTKRNGKYTPDELQQKISFEESFFSGDGGVEATTIIRLSV